MKPKYMKPKYSICAFREDTPDVTSIFGCRRLGWLRCPKITENQKDFNHSAAFLLLSVPIHVRSEGKTEPAASLKDCL